MAATKKEKVLPAIWDILETLDLKLTSNIAGKLTVKELARIHKQLSAALADVEAGYKRIYE
jgi:hypothetical protein